MYVSSSSQTRNKFLTIVARGPCPALNSLANHGFLPRSGRNINAVQVVTGAFLGLGVSPETSGEVLAVGYASSHNILSLGFDLEDLSKHMFAIEHDCSFSRDDYRTGDNNAFNFQIWKTALDELSKSDGVDPFAMGRAKSARVQAQRLINNELSTAPELLPLVPLKLE